MKISGLEIFISYIRKAGDGAFLYTIECIYFPTAFSFVVNYDLSIGAQG